MNDNEDIPEMVRRMQRASEGYAKGEVELPLESEPRLYRLPRCKKGAATTGNPDKVGLLLDTEGDHRFVIDLDVAAAKALFYSLEHAIAAHEK